MHYPQFHCIPAWEVWSLSLLPANPHTSSYGLHSQNGKSEVTCMYSYLCRIHCNMSPTQISSQPLLILTWLSTLQSSVTLLFTSRDGIQTAWADLFICQRHLPTGAMRNLIWRKFTVRAGSRVTLQTTRMVPTRQFSFTHSTTGKVFWSWGLSGTQNFTHLFPTVTLCRRISHN